MLDLAQRGEVVVQFDLLAVLGLAVGHHVRLELQVSVMGLDDDHLAGQGNTRRFKDWLLYLLSHRTI